MDSVMLYVVVSLFCFRTWFQLYNAGTCFEGIAGVFIIGRLGRKEDQNTTSLVTPLECNKDCNSKNIVLLFN